MGKILSLDIGGTKILGALFDEKGEILKREKKSSKSNKGIEKVKNQIKKVIDILIEGETDIEAIGCGVPGIIKEGKILFTPNMPLSGFSLKEFLEENYKVDVYVGNDANVALYGEYNTESISKYDNIVGFFIGTGFGGGIIIDRKIYKGSIGASAEIGHITVNPDGPYCGCGSRGCVESFASKVAIQKSLSNQIKKGRDSSIKEYILDDSIIKSSILLKAYEENDELVVEIMDEVAKYIGIVSANIMNIFNPQIIILGGGLIESFSDKLLETINEYSKKYSLKQNYESTEFKIASLGDDACIFGAYQMAKNRVD